MGTINVSFADVEGGDRTPIKAGKYPVVINGIEVRQSQSGTHPYLNWELEITDGEHEGRKLYMITSLSPKALWNLQSVLTSFGLEDEELELEVDDDTNVLLSPDLTGEAGIATVVNKLYEGKAQAKVTNLQGGEERPKKKRTTAAASKPKRKPVEEDEEEEEEEEEEAPKPKVKAKAKAKPEPEPEEEDEEEEEEEEKPKKVSPFNRGKKPVAKKRFR